MEQLSGSYRTIAVDLPGHGDSSKPDWSWYSIPRYAGLVADLMGVMGLESARLVGHSMGGTIALEAARSFPGAFACLVVVNPVVTGRVYSKSVALPEEWMPSAVRLSRRVWPTATRLLTRPPGKLRRQPPDHVRRNTEDLGRTTADSFLGSMRAVLSWDLTDRLSEIRTPTLVLVGESDRVVAPSEGELAAGRVPGARLERLRAGHHPNDEDPQSFHRSLRRFLGEGGGR